MADWVNVEDEGFAQSTWKSHKLNDVEVSVVPSLMGFSILTMNSSRPAGGGLVPSTSAGIKLWPRYTPSLSGLVAPKHCGVLTVPLISMLVRSKAQARIPDSASLLLGSVRSMVA